MTLAPPNPETDKDDGDFADLLQELRVVQEAASLLVGFLLVASLRADFAGRGGPEKWIYLTTFFFATAGLVFLLTPPARHRIQRPLTDRQAFKRSASRMMLAGQACLSVAVTLASMLAVHEAAGLTAGAVMALLVGGLIATFWWVLPLMGRGRQAIPGPTPTRGEERR